MLISNKLFLVYNLSTKILLTFNIRRFYVSFDMMYIPLIMILSFYWLYEDVFMFGSACSKETEKMILRQIIITCFALVTMDIENLRQQNARQSHVIKILGEAINNDTKKKELIKNVEKHELSNQQFQNQLQYLITNLEAKNAETQSDRERELLELIKIQEEKFETLTQQIQEYQRKAAEFEAEIERNEAEKQALIDNLRNRRIDSHSQSSNQDISSLFGSSMKQDNEEELYQKIKEADEEIESLTKELEALNKTLEEKQEEYQQIQEKFLNQ